MYAPANEYDTQVKSQNQTVEKMELALVGAGVGGVIKNTGAFKVLNFKKSMRNSDADA